MVSLVERMLELHKRLVSARASADHEMYQRQIEATDRQTARPVLLGVDALVYELYGLTEDEIRIIEGE
jgi:hypothetical protein